MGPGLLESIYEASLCHELSLRKLNFQKQLPVPVRYKGVVIKDPLYLDLIVEGKIIVEVKATEQDFLIHQTQLVGDTRDFWVIGRSGIVLGNENFQGIQRGKSSYQDLLDCGGRGVCLFDGIVFVPVRVVSVS